MEETPAGEQILSPEETQELMLAIAAAPPEERPALMSGVQLAKIRISGVSYDFPDLDKCSLGEARVCKRITGRGPQQAFRELPADDPDLHVFLVWLAMSRKSPGLTLEDVEKIGYIEVEFQARRVDAGPPDGDAGDEPSIPATTPETPGNPTLPASTD